MRLQDRVFHLAIPCDDLKTTKEFYSQFNGCKFAREYDDRVTFDFFGDQLVCHLHPEYNTGRIQLYPRHFGITFLNEKDWLDVLEQAQKNDIKFFNKPFVRFEGKREEHKTFVLIDPSKNLLEFKYYLDPAMAY